MLSKIKESFKNSISGRTLIPAIAAFGIASMPLSAHADNHCSPLLDNKHGVQMSAGGSASMFSYQSKGNVGIAIYAGSDLKRLGYTPEQIGAYLVSQIENAEGINAQCFINDKDLPGGTRIVFVVDEVNVPASDTGVSLSAAIKEETLRTVKGTATLVQHNASVNKGNSETIAMR